MTLALTSLLGLAFAYQLIALPLYTFSGIGPDFVLAAVCALSVYGRPGVAAALAVVCGASVDGLSLDPWGAHALGYLAASWLLIRARARRLLGDGLSVAVFLVAASITATAVHDAILFVAEGGDLLPAWSNTALETLYCAATSCVVTGAVSAFHRAIAGPRRHSEFHQATPPVNGPWYE